MEIDSRIFYHDVHYQHKYGLPKSPMLHQEFHGSRALSHTRPMLHQKLDAYSALSQSRPMLHNHGSRAVSQSPILSAVNESLKTHL